METVIHGAMPTHGSPATYKKRSSAPEISGEELGSKQLEEYVSAFENRMLDCSQFHQRLSDNVHSTTILIYSNNADDLSSGSQRLCRLTNCPDRLLGT